MQLIVFTDGGAIGNPGPAALAFVVYSANKILFQFSARIGRQTNNYAEYAAVLEFLRWLSKNKPAGVEKIILNSDSSLMINQLNGFFKVKNSIIRDFVLQIRVLEQQVKTPIIYKHIPREQNQTADWLVKKRLAA